MPAVPALRATLVAAFAVSLVACGGGSPPAPTTPVAPAPPAVPVAEAKPAQPEHAHEVAPAKKHWSYAGDEGPEHWSDLESGFAQCKAGQRQSPIDLPATAPVDKAFLLSTPTYAPVPLRIINNGHTIQVNDTASSSLMAAGVKYELVQFHFHSPSEHTIAGKSFDAEMHLVHKSADGKLLVVGVLFSKGKENAALKTVWDAMPAEPTKEDTVVAGATIDLAKLLPANPRYDHYEGSLTVPPCGEGVSWLVVQPEKTGGLELSEDQIAHFRTATHGTTNRPVQPLNGRSVSEVHAAKAASAAKK